jgi:uncharacterized membrane protein
MNNAWLIMIYHISVHVFLTLLAVVVVDIIAWCRGLPSISGSIRTTWLSWPVGVLAALVVGVVVLAHFVNQRFPGQ